MHIHISGTVRVPGKRWPFPKPKQVPFNHKINCNEIEGLPGGIYLVRSFMTERNVITVILAQPNDRESAAVLADRQPVRFEIPGAADGVITDLMVEIHRTKGDLVDLSDRLKMAGHQL